MADQTARSCIDCTLASCERPGSALPKFCVTALLPDEERQSVKDAYGELGEDKLLKVTAKVSADAYNEHWSRLEELMLTCRRMGWGSIGIASCTAMQEEQRLLGRKLRAEGFEVFGVACKAGSIRQCELGLCEEDNGYVSCNPILQARILNAQNTDLNVIVGLCIGHEMLFQRHSNAPCTVFAVRDFAFDNKTVEALFQA